MPAGVESAPPPSPKKCPTGFRLAPEFIVPLVVTVILLSAEAGIAKAELAARIPVPSVVSVLSAPVDTLTLPVLAAKRGLRCRTCRRWKADAVAFAPPSTMMLPVPAVIAWMADELTLRCSAGIVLMIVTSPELLTTILLESSGFFNRARGSAEASHREPIGPPASRSARIPSPGCRRGPGRPLRRKYAVAAG